MIGVVIAMIIAIVIAIFAWVFSIDNAARNRFNSWTQDCLRSSGQISQVRMGFSSERYECFVDGKQVTLPGWEGY